MKALRIVLWILGTLLVLALAAGFWLMRTTSGARTAIHQVEKRSRGMLQVGAVEGTLAGPLVLRDVTYTAATGVTVKLARARAKVALAGLLQRSANIETVAVEGVTITLPERPVEEPERVAFAPLALPTLKIPAPPLALHVANLTVVRAAVKRGERELIRFDDLAAVGHWTSDSLAIERLTVSGPDGGAELQAKVPVGNSGQVNAAGSIRWRIGASEYVANLASRAEGSDTRLELSVTSPFAGRVTAWWPPAGKDWRIEVDLPAFDPRGIVLPAEHGMSLLGGTLAATGNADHLRVRGKAVVNGENIALEEAALRVRGADIEIESLLARLPAHEANVRASGTISRTAETSLVVVWEEFTLPEAWVRRPLRTRGEMRVTGPLAELRAAGELALGPPGRLSNFEIVATRRGHEVDLEILRIVQPDGSLAARGTIRTGPRTAWDLSLEASAFNPGEFLAAWPGRLSGQIGSRGEFGGRKLRGELSIDRLEGTLRGRPVTGQGRLTVGADRLIDGTLSFSSAGTRVNIATVPGGTPEAIVSLSVESLADWLPGAAGRVAADFRLRGQWPDIGVMGRGDAMALRYAAVSAERVVIDAQVENLRALRGSLKANVDKLAASGRRLDHVELNATGDQGGHKVQVVVTGEPFSGSAEVRGQWASDHWEGGIEALDLRWGTLLALALAEPATAQYSRDRGIELARLCLVGHGTRWCLENFQRGPAGLGAKFAIEEFPLPLIASFVPSRLPRIDGRASVHGNVQQERGEWSGAVQLSSVRADIAAGMETADAPPALLLYENLKVDARLQDGSVQAHVSMGLIAQGRLEAGGTVKLGDEPAVEGKLQANVPSIAPVVSLWPVATAVDGKVAADLQLRGPLRHPEISGHLELSALRANFPRLGLELTEGRVRAEPTTDGSLRITGQLASGGGQASLEGTWVLAGKSSIAIKGEKFVAANLPSARVVIAPDLVVAHEATGVRITGRVAVPNAAVNLQQLPQGKARRQSRDVVVVDRQTKEKARTPIPMSAEVKVEIGPEVAVTGFGLEAKLRGQLNVVEAPGVLTTASGEIVLAGTYQGYGQDLKITRGRVLYAATPISDPRLDITAVREIEKVKAGVRISGTAQAPEVTVFADPAMGQADALAYLVTGKPLDKVGAGEETDMLDSAARSLGTAAGAMVAGRIGRRLGIDEVGIEKSDMVEGEVFTIGQYLSPRLYVAYGVGLFDAGDLVTLRYKLSESLDLRAVRGPEETRAGIEYRIER